MSKLNISFSNLKRIGAMSLAIMTFSGCSKAVANTTSSQNESNSYVAGSYLDESSIDENSLKTNLTEIAVVDATNGENIPGAMLQIKDENGKVIIEFVTTHDSHYVELKSGKYTLIETIAPEGYESSYNVISFNVCDGGKLVKIINEPIQKVKTR